MFVRAEKPSDQKSVHKLNLAAFDGSAEAKLVDGLRENADPVVSLVAEDNGEIVGHIMFSPVAHSADPALKLMGLAPMAVVPDRQKAGIGAALICAGLERCNEMGVVGVVVLGHPNYYPRFGFVPSSRYKIVSEYDVPEEVFMVIELLDGALNDKPGRVHYHREFSKI
ncbi:MAG: GNAT family N-acetyltransferase [Woeseiaceae bacterium]